MRIAINELERLVDLALERSGYDDEERRIIADVLLYAQLRDNSQGVVKLVGQGMPKDPAAGEMRTIRETPVSLLLDGNRNAGMVVVSRAAHIAVAKAREHGFGLVGTNNTNTSTGAIGYYARLIAEEGLFGFVFSGSVRTVAPHGSFEPVFGTNPIAVGIPLRPHPIVIDMATSAVAWYALVEASISGRPIPEDVAYDAEGLPTSDPQAAMEGALRPFDRGQKGSALSFLVEVLTGPLVAAGTAGFGADAESWGNLVLALDPAILVPRGQFGDHAEALRQAVKRARTLPGVEQVLLPGERGDGAAEARSRSGAIEMEDQLHQLLREAAGEAG